MQLFIGSRGISRMPNHEVERTGDPLRGSPVAYFYRSASMRRDFESRTAGLSTRLAAA